MVMGNPMTVKDTFPPGKVHITWLDSDGLSQWKQRFEFNQHAYYQAYWTKDASPERKEEGQCTRQ